MALTPAEKQRRYRERHKNRPTPAQQIEMLKARVAELEQQLKSLSEPETVPLKSIDTSIIHQWEQALGRPGKR